jgi:hypothetical protein
MTPFDVPPDEMGIDPEIANEELEALLAGHGRDKNLDLTRFVDDLSTAFPAQAPATAAHLAAIANEAQLLADKGDPVARPASNAVAPARASRPPKRWRNTMKDRKARILIKIAAPVVALFAVLGIMGSAGALPRTLQHLTAHAAGIVGFDLPTGEDEGNDTTADDQGDQNDQGDDVKDATDEGDQGGDATTDTSDQGDQNDQGDSTSSDTTDQGDQNEGDPGDTSTGSSDQGDESDQGDSTGSSDQGDQNDQGDSTGSSGSGSSENDQGDGGSSQDDQGDSSGDGGSSGSGDNQD